MQKEEEKKNPCYHFNNHTMENKFHYSCSYIYNMLNNHHSYKLRGSYITSHNTF